jgi:hypothetical protein
LGQGRSGDTVGVVANSPNRQPSDSSIASQLIEEFPELRESYLELLSELAEDSNSVFSLYPLWTDSVMPHLVWPALESHDSGRLSRFYRIVEPLAGTTDAYLKNFVAVEICEVLMCNEDWHDFAWPLLGPKVKSACAELFEYQRSFRANPKPD